VNELERALAVCKLLSERRTRTMPESIWIGSGPDPEIRTKSMTVTRVSEKADLGQIREVVKQLLAELSGVDLSPEAHRLLARLAESLSAFSSTPPPDEGDQAEKSGWQNPDSEFRPAFELPEARRGRRDSATAQKGIRGPKDAALHEFVQRAQLAVLEERAREIGRGIDEVRRKSVEPARALFDRLGEAIEKKKSSRGKDL